MGRYAGWEKLSLADLSKRERKQLQTHSKPSKYKNVKTVVDGITFDSKKEAARYNELKLMEKAGLIRDLLVQAPIQLLAHCVATDRPCGVGLYYADFSYTESDGNVVVEDVKSSATRTALYQLKKLLVFACHGIEITEV